MRPPQPVGVANAHLQDAPVAVYVLDRQALDLVFVVRVGTRARAHPFWLVGERPFGAVGVYARTDVEHARIQRARDVGIAAVTADQVVEEVHRGSRCRDLGRVDVAVDPEGGLVEGGPAGRVCHGGKPDVPALVALAYRLQSNEFRILGGEGSEYLA